MGADFVRDSGHPLPEQRHAASHTYCPTFELLERYLQRCAVQDADHSGDLERRAQTTVRNSICHCIASAKSFSGLGWAIQPSATALLHFVLTDPEHASSNCASRATSVRVRTSFSSRSLEGWPMPKLIVPGVVRCRMSAWGSCVLGGRIPLDSQRLDLRQVRRGRQVLA